MKQLEKHMHVLKMLNELPRKTTLLHDREHVPHLVLYDMCHEACFNLEKAAYFVDNPVFDCLKGVAGLCKKEPDFCKGIEDVWQQPDEYETYLKKSPFNQQVRQFAGRSKKKSSSEADVLVQLARQFNFSRPHHFDWPMKHDNYGLLMVQVDEQNSDIQELIDEHLGDGVHYLSFCSIC